MAGITIHEFDVLFPAEEGDADSTFRGPHSIPPRTYQWLEARCLEASEAGGPVWLRMIQRAGRRGVQVTSYVGVIRAADGFQIEVLPKVGRTTRSGDIKVRQLLIRMLSCLEGFRHIHSARAHLLASRMPLWEVFIAEFLNSVSHVLKRGIRSAYLSSEDDKFSLRGKLKVATHLRRNLCRKDRFYVEFDEFSTDRPENRLIHSALRRVGSSSSSPLNQQLGRELLFAFSEIPESSDFARDFQRTKLDRGMGYYEEALAWARLILNEFTPLAGSGHERAPSLLFPMEAVFEAYVAKKLARQLPKHLVLRTQVQRRTLVMHEGQHWFRLKPDLLVHGSMGTHLVLDTKWKLLNASQSNGSDKYGLSQADFYQLFAYGHYYLDGRGDIVLIYPKTEMFPAPLPAFVFSEAQGMRLWVLPFCLETDSLILPDELQWEALSGS